MSFARFTRLYLSPDGDGGAGGASGDGKTPPPDDKKGDQKDDKSQNSDTSKDGGKTSSEGDKKFTQKELDDIVTSRLNREKAKQDQKAKEAQGEFQKLYDELKPKFESTETELTEVKTKFKSLEDSIHSMIDETIKEWPDEVKALDPGNSDVLKRQEWIKKSAPLAAKLSGKTSAPNYEQGKQGKTDEKSAGITSSFMASRYGIPKN